MRRASVLGLISSVRLDGKMDIQSVKLAWSVFLAELRVRIQPPLQGIIKDVKRTHMRCLIVDKYRVSVPICAFLFVIRHFHQVCVFIKNTINSLFDCIRSQRVDIAVYPLQF